MDTVKLLETCIWHTDPSPIYSQHISLAEEINKQCRHQPPSPENRHRKANIPYAMSDGESRSVITWSERLARVHGLPIAVNITVILSDFEYQTPYWDSLRRSWTAAFSRPCYMTMSHFRFFKGRVSSFIDGFRIVSSSAWASEDEAPPIIRILTAVVTCYPSTTPRQRATPTCRGITTNSGVASR
jgi:hypothetical protein